MNAVGFLGFALWTGTAIAASAWLLERTGIGLRLPVRWVWLGAMTLSAWLPLQALVFPPREQPAATIPADVAPEASIGAAPGAASAATDELLDRLFGWWVDPGQVIAARGQAFPLGEGDPRWIAALWGASSLLVALVLGLSLLRLRRRARAWPDATLLGRPVKVSPALGPATLGFIDPRIVVPEWAVCLPDEELDLILRHEGEHVRARDTLLLGIGMLAVITCPWNPALWWEMRRLRDAVEVDCDRRVLQRGTVAVRYGSLLVRLGSRARFRPMVVATIAGSPSLLQRRLKLMTRMHRRTSIARVLPLAGLAVLLLAVACSSEAPVATEGLPEIRAAAESESQDESIEPDVLISVDQDGAVTVNGTQHPVEAISDVAGDLAPPNGIAAIEGHQSAPYAAVAAVQEELRMADLLRVAFTVVRSTEERLSGPDGNPVPDRRLAVVLPDPTMPYLGDNLSETAQRNLLNLWVLESGSVEVARAASTQRQVIQRDEVESVVRASLAANPNLIVFLRTRPKAEYRYMYDVLGAIQRAEATRFALDVAG